MGKSEMGRGGERVNEWDVKRERARERWRESEREKERENEQ